MTWFFAFALFAGGYTASVYTWPKVKEWVNGAENEIASLRARIDALKGKL